MEHFSSEEETSLGVLDYNAVRDAMEKQSKTKKQKNCSFIDEERFKIVEYTSVHGPAAVVKKFKKTHLHLKFGESTARSFRAKYEEPLKKQTRDQTSKITSQKRGRP